MSLVGKRSWTCWNALDGLMARSVSKKTGCFKGIRGQWLGAYVSPFASNEGEIVVILEDDIVVSPWFFYWLKRAHRAFANRTDVAGFSLQRRKITASGAAIANVQTQNNTPYLQLQVGPWGFSPRREVWAQFVQEYDNIDIDQNTLISSAWYRKHQEEGRSHAMWTHHFLSYCKAETLYTVFPNLPGGLVLAVHREVDGEHFSGPTTVGTAVERGMLQEEYTGALATFEPDHPVRIGIVGWGQTAGGALGGNGDHNRSGVNFVSTQFHGRLDEGFCKLMATWKRHHLHRHHPRRVPSRVPASSHSKRPLGISLFLPCLSLECCWLFCSIFV